jgi:hypothetical protein
VDDLQIMKSVDRLLQFLYSSHDVTGVSGYYHLKFANVGVVVIAALISLPMQLFIKHVKGTGHIFLTH